MPKWPVTESAMCTRPFRVEGARSDFREAAAPINYPRIFSPGLFERRQCEVPLLLMHQAMTVRTEPVSLT